MRRIFVVSFDHLESKEFSILFSLALKDVSKAASANFAHQNVKL